MNSGVQVAASGMRAQVEALDMLSHNLANLNTTGYKEQKAFYTCLDEASAASSTQDANPFASRTVSAQGALNLTDGSLQPTGRDFDIALIGDGYLTVETPQGIRYTRDGSLRLNGKSELVTAGGYPVLDFKARHITVGPGRLNITESGAVYSDDRNLGQLKLVRFEKPADLIREGNSLLLPSNPSSGVKPANVQVKQGFLEQSNVNAVASVVEMVGIMRHFEAISKSVNILVNDLDSKAIERLGR